MYVCMYKCCYFYNRKKFSYSLYCTYHVHFHLCVLQFDRLERGASQRLSWGRWLASITEQVPEERLMQYQRVTFEVAIRYIQPGSATPPPPTVPPPAPQQQHPQQTGRSSLDQYLVSPAGQPTQQPQQLTPTSFIQLLAQPTVHLKRTPTQPGQVHIIFILKIYIYL